jgi:dynein heavy chain 1
MERALALIDEQLKSDQIVLTLEILKTAKRFAVTVSFLADTGLKASTEKVSKYNLLMKEFPINELLSAPDIERVGDSLVQIFQHFNKKLRLSPYPVARALPLVEAISRDFNDQILKVLGSKRLLYVSYTEFEQTINGCDKVFSVWDEQVLFYML